MKKIILCIATSLDQRIANLDGGLEWLAGFPNFPKISYGYNDLLALVDTVIMGGRTYRELLNMDIIWPYKELQTYVVTHYKWSAKENVSFITENIIETILELCKREGKDIWLIGGSELISILLAVDLIDEMRIVYIPVILGKGIPLFFEQIKESKWELTANKSYENGILTVSYRKIFGK